MNNTQKAIIVFSIMTLGGAGIYLYEGSTGYSISGSDCYCTSCSDCTSALSDATCMTVYLNNSIIYDSAYYCITAGNDVTKTLDCQNYIIESTHTPVLSGILFDNMSNSTIKNCFIKEFFHSIQIKNSNNISLISNTLTTGKGRNIYITNSNLINITNNDIKSSYSGLYTDYSAGIYIYNSNNNSISSNNIMLGLYCILLDNSNNNSILSNNIMLSKYCILVDNSNNNTINNNTLILCSSGMVLEELSNTNTITSNLMCSNSYKDIQSEILNNSGANNTCETHENWNDTGTIGCTYLCIGAGRSIKCWANATITNTTTNEATVNITINGESFNSTAFATVKFINININKTTTGNVQYKHKGHYIIYINNTGSEELNIQSLIDSVYGKINLLTNCSPSTGKIKAGEMIICQFDSNTLYTTERNNITVVGTFEGYNITDWDNETIYVYGSSVCNITSLKVANGTRFRCNDSVSYNISLNNTGICDFINLKISDQYSTLVNPYITCNLTGIPAMINLSAGEYWSYKYNCIVNCLK